VLHAGPARLLPPCRRARARGGDGAWAMGNGRGRNGSVGSVKRRRGSSRQTATIDAPADAVYVLIADPARRVDWLPELAVTSGGDRILETGDRCDGESELFFHRFMGEQRGGGRRLGSLPRGRTGGGARLRSRWELSPDGPGRTTVTHTLEVDFPQGPLAGVARWALMRRLDRLQCKGLDGSVALVWTEPRPIAAPASEIRLERRCELIERCCKVEPGPGLGTEFVVMPSQVVDEGLSADDRCGSAVAFEPTHRAEWRLQSAVVGFDPVVGVLVGVVKRRRCGFVDGTPERWCLVGDDFGRFTVVAERLPEEPSCRGGVRRGDTKTSMTWPLWSTARYTYRQQPATLT